MSKDRYLLFPCKPRMWQGLPTDKVFGSGVARMTDFDPRTVLSLSEYAPLAFPRCIFVTSCACTCPGCRNPTSCWAAA